MTLFTSSPYDTLRDFEPVILCFKGANVVAVHPSLPARNVRELIALAKAQPGRLNYATRPTFDESGVKGYEVTNWFGLLAPAKTPREAVDRVNHAVDGVVRGLDFRERFVREGLEAADDSPESFGGFLREEIDKYARVIKFANIPRQ